ncbi:SpvB/TcaC N-terminal domain-containing protein [Pseudomonas sp. UFMG81]|uniref:SpvB/TcaC N-terminal domain-containing protein n=1 Tax=Pseudomonas sp. UFMG81 TaxID=2745936 RepID=UPI00188E66AE|nr:SpvB/TcaC N-terminal domain-containing protein [Pseudomonas sp. UFMG81]
MAEMNPPAPVREEPSPFYTPPALPKGGGTVSIGGGMLSAGGPDGAAGWQLPLPSPIGRALSASLALQYTSAGGNSVFGAGWDSSQPAIARMTRFGFPRYDGSDRLAGPSGEEVLQSGAPYDARALPFDGDSGNYTVTPWRERSGSPAQRLEHWLDKDAADHPGFWLEYLADGSLSLYGWSASARLHDPATPGHVALWYLEETVSARGEHVVYRYRGEDERNCSPEELAAHPQVVNVYPDGVYAMNVTPSEALLIPQAAFQETDFLTFTLFDYGERGADPDTPPTLAPLHDWPVREDCHSFWRYGFEVRLRRLCREVLAWHRTARMAGEADDTPALVGRLHLAYDASPVSSLLVSVRQLSEGLASPMPPLEFDLSRPGRAAPGWEPVNELDGFWSPAWQLADLYGEGIPGLLYLDEGAWRYRAPERGDAGPDAIAWGAPQVLPAHPVPSSGTLVDLDSDGRPEWLVTAGGLQGSFTLAPDGRWGGLVPMAALPAEYGHEQAVLADLTGGGRQDLVMLRALGPRSVRLYPSNGTAGWLAGVHQAYTGREPLPSLAESEHQLVAFADPAGSGQAHLLRITGERVTVWPSLGHGRFAEAIDIPGFSVADFAAARVFLADTDGAGTTDILYLQPDGIRVFVSQAGNRYQEGAFIPAPAGVTLDPTCQLQVADIRGQGTADLLLTMPHGLPDHTPRSWLYRFNDRRPWLLEQVVDNAGSSTELEYRSSAQTWLDEKAEVRRRTGSTPVSYLPFPVHTLSRVTRINQVTGLCLGSQTTYLGGVWDGEEREFAGFTRLIQTDTHERAGLTAAQLSPPARVCTWFLSGVEPRDAGAQGAFTGIDQAFTPDEVRFTRWSAGGEEVIDPEPGLRAWLYRALRGQLMRTEVYGEDGHALADKPYSVARQRFHIRAYDTLDGQCPAAMVTLAQALAFACERITEDPQVTQRLVLEMDAYGSVLQSVEINYPRQLSEAQLIAEDQDRLIYPATLPEGLIKASCDPQQYHCWVSLVRNSVHNLASGNEFVIGLPGTTRTDVVRLTVDEVPDGGFSVEYLLEHGLPLNDPARTTLAGYQKTVWRRADGSGASSVPSRQALLAYTRTAMLDKAALDALRPAFRQTFADLVGDALDKPGADKAVLERMRQQLPTLPSPALAYALLMGYLQHGAGDPQACNLLRGGLKAVISVDDLRLRLLEADPAQLPEGLQAGLRKQGRVPDAALWAVVDWFVGQQDTLTMTTLFAALEAALSNPSAQGVFWRAVLVGLQAKGMPAQAQTWLEQARQLLDRPVQAESLAQLLKRGGYMAMNQPVDAAELADPQDPAGLGVPGVVGEPQVEEAYAGHHGITTYQGAAHFWLPASVQESTQTGPSQLAYSAYDIAVREVTDATGLKQTVEAYDWRFLQPVRIKDGNDNISEAGLDGLGRLRHTRFHGTETPAGSTTPVMVGYDPHAPFAPPSTVEDAVALNDSKAVPVAEAFTFIADSWMPFALNADGSLDRVRRCGELAWRRDAHRLHLDGIAPPLMAGRTPPHVIQIQTDRYDSDPQQQVRVRVLLGTGEQPLQAAILSPPGEAFVRSEDGGLEVDAQGHAIVREADIRWAVTGKTEFDDKGQVVRVWLPFYLDDWRWVSDDSAREGIYADTHVYDALGRESKVVRAAGEEVDGLWVGYERRAQVYPWFSVVEDENDTWQEVVERQQRRAD